MPFKSKAQQRFMFAAEARGELPEGTARRWAHETPDIKKLPEKKGEKKRSETLLEHVFSTKAKKHQHLKEKKAISSALERRGLGGQEADNIAEAKTANYKLQGERMFRGLDLAIENKKGSKRSWYDPHGKEKGSTYMHFDYGYIRMTEGTDGDHVDVYVGPNESAEKVFIVNQMKKPEFKVFDEQKVMLGFDSAEAAKKAYLKQYNDPKFFGSMKEMDFEEFKTKVLDKQNHGKKIAEARSADDLWLDSVTIPIIKKLKKGQSYEGEHTAPHDNTTYKIRIHQHGNTVRDAYVYEPETVRKKIASGDMLQYFADHPEKLREKRERDRKKTAVLHTADGAIFGGAAADSQVGKEACGDMLQYYQDHPEKLKEKKERDKKAALSPALLSGLQHGAIGAGIGALAGGAGGLAHADAGHRGQGLLRGALVGAGIGAAGGAGVSAIKQQGARQLASLRGAATEAEQFAGRAHQHVQDLSQSAFHGKPTIAPAAVNPHAPTLAAAPGGTMAGKLNANVGPKAVPQGAHIDTVAANAMRPEAYGYRATEAVHPGGVMGADDQLYRPMTRPPMQQHGGGTIAPAAHPPAVVASSSPTLSGKLDVAQDQARAAGARATALGSAANTLEQQQQVLHRGINRGALAGAAAGAGLMGYMAVPHQYGGVGTQPKTAEEIFIAKKAADEHTIADRLDDVGIATLASPYVADLAAGGMKRLMLRGGRLGALAAEGHGIAEALSHKLHHPAVELGGLALVAPGVTHSLAKLAPKKAVPAPPQQLPSVNQEEILKSAAEEVGRVLANIEHQVKHSGYGRLALGLGAVGAVGAGLYGGKKVIDTTKSLATHHAEPARYVGSPPGMRPAAAAGV